MIVLSDRLGVITCVFKLLAFIAALSCALSRSAGGGDFKASRYDKSINVFAPNGDLLQVAYAEIAAERGAPVVCWPTADEGLVVCMPSDPEHDVLLDRRLVDKISKIDDEVWMAFAGLAGDGRALVRIARAFCNDYHVRFGCAPPLSAIAKHLGETQHKSTLVGNERPLGVQSMVFGYDKAVSKPLLYSIKPSGLVSSWKAYAIGKDSAHMLRHMESIASFEPAMELENAIIAAVGTLDTCSKGEPTANELSDDNNDRLLDGKSTTKGAKYDVYYLRRGLGGVPLVSVTSVFADMTDADQTAPNDNDDTNANIAKSLKQRLSWMRRNDVNANDGNPNRRLRLQDELDKENG